MLMPTSLTMVITAPAHTTPTTAERMADDSAFWRASARVRSIPGRPNVRFSSRPTALFTSQVSTIATTTTSMIRKGVRRCISSRRFTHCGCDAVENTTRRYPFVEDR